MSHNKSILILGASYGSLLGLKLTFGGHNVTLVCLPDEVEAFNAQGAIVRLPVRGVDGLVELNSQHAPGTLGAAGPAAVDPAKFDLVCFAMQEPQYGAPEIADLLARTAEAGVPCMSIMNMPPLPYLARIPGLDIAALESCYAAPSSWRGFDPDLVTLASPDPQAFRPPGEPVNVLQVALPTNFKVARFASDEHTALLRQLEADIEAIRVPHGGAELTLPVKLRVHDSLFVPLAKWAMLLTGNYRCVQDTEMRPIAEAVHSDLETSREIYEWVSDVCVKVGADPEDLVPFEKYAAAAMGLAKPSSAARALAAGIANIERVDALVLKIAEQFGLAHPEVQATVSRVEAWLASNRAPKQAA
ncbi:MAG: hypothetical protein AAF441_10245 [Pseudomonadota bacterium]